MHQDVTPNHAQARKENSELLIELIYITWINKLSSAIDFFM